ncbi:hypothetical protein QMK33_02495 [Hymenobacter sp. H14-R3]|uniref:hypothetical protein n=1 Tax=Hymenobacter sp. H14-R3 TaxID=3046308 RepID=UPI0024BB51B9|nr:hypothetical protein [Hymenobacter sp. H14-R3]MDJ0364007.1 hypothetical protein [Hymenobacter sp. H14-R3]
MLALFGLAGCTSDAENKALHVVEKFYGGHATYLKGSHFSANAREPQGKFLQLSLGDVDFASTYGTDLEVPAANCAYLLYHQMTAAERTAYDYLSIKLIEGQASHTLPFSMASLALADQGVSRLTTIMAALQRQDYQYVVARLDPAAFGATSPGNMPPRLAAITQQLTPLASYQLLGYARVNGRTPSQHNLRFYLTVPGPTKPRALWLTLNPRLGPNDPFLIGLHLFN